MTRQTDESDPHANHLREGRYSVAWQAYCVTKCVRERRPILAEPTAAESVIRCLAHVREQGAIKLLAFVVMPDHYHAIFVLCPGTELSGLMRRIGSYTARKIRAELGLAGAVWQDSGFHDRACRSDEEVLNLAEYIHHNPVRCGLVQAAEAWPYSSAHPSQRTILDWGWWSADRLQ